MAGKITLAGTNTPIAATTTVDTMITVGTDGVRIWAGDPTSIDLDDYTPTVRGQIIIFPAGVDVSGYSTNGSSSVWVLDFG